MVDGGGSLFFRRINAGGHFNSDGYGIDFFHGREGELNSGSHVQGDQRKTGLLNLLPSSLWAKTSSEVLLLHFILFLEISLVYFGSP